MVLVRRTIWVQVGAVALCGGDPTVKRTALELVAVPADGATTRPQAPAGAIIKSYFYKMSHYLQCFYCKETENLGFS